MSGSSAQGAEPRSREERSSGDSPATPTGERSSARDEAPAPAESEGSPEASEAPLVAEEGVNEGMDDLLEQAPEADER